METVAKIFGRRETPKVEAESPLLQHQSHIGVEVELERASPLARAIVTAKQNYWSIKPDGSLRDDGHEFVFKRPLAGKDVEEAFKLLTDLAEKNEPNSSINCSTHVHMDFTNQNVDEVLNFVFTYMLVEDTLAEYCGDWRKNNLYCLTFSNAEHLTDIVRDLYQTKDLHYIAAVGENQLKYAALNLYTLRKFGTLESRLAKGFYKPQDILSWVNILFSIRKYAEQLESPMDLLIAVSRDGVHGMFREIFGDYYEALHPYIQEEGTFEAIDRIQYIMSRY